MAYNPKGSQVVMSWCVESVIGLLFRAAESLGEKLSSPKMHQLVADKFGKVASSKQIGKMIYHLKRQDYVRFGEGDSVVLTNKAKIKIIDQVVSENIFDGRLRLISFDIPEIKRLSRNKFRRAIKRLGFRQIQKSLWVSDKNIGDIVEMLAEEYQIGKYVAYFVVDASNIDRHIADIINRD